MHMIRHDDKRIIFRDQEMLRDCAPTRLCDFGRRVQDHPIIDDSPEQRLVRLCVARDKIPA
jgi:hypothetical protein